MLRGPLDSGSRNLFDREREKMASFPEVFERKAGDRERFL